MFEFEHPFFLLLIPVAAALVFYLYRQRSAIGFSTLSLFRGARFLPLHRLQQLFLVAAATFALLILATPLETKEETVLTSQEVHNFMVTVDISGSMNSPVPTDPGQRNRLTIAKDVIKLFVEKHPRDRIGLVSFDTSGYLEWPLSLEHGGLLTRLKQIEVGGGTSIEEGILTSLGQLKATGQSGAIIILSDGESTVPPEAWAKIIKLSKETKARIYWIWIGDPGDLTASAFKRLVISIGGRVYQNSPSDIYLAFEDISKIEANPLVTSEKVTLEPNYGPLFLLLLLSLAGAALLERVKEV